MALIAISAICIPEPSGAVDRGPVRRGKRRAVPQKTARLAENSPDTAGVLPAGSGAPRACPAHGAGEIRPNGGNVSAARAMNYHRL